MDSVTQGFTTADRERFNNLLQLAARTSFPGERENALAAAERLAARHGMTLSEAAAYDAPPHPEVVPPPVDPVWAGVVRSAHLTDAFIVADKRRREEALRAARARGLDEEMHRVHHRQPPRTARKSRARGGRSPSALAQVLLNETSLSLSAVADITGLDIYAVTSLKLKLRASA